MALPAKLKPKGAPARLSEAELEELWNGRTDLQKKWLLEYLDNGFNATQAAKDAGYKCGTEQAYRQQGSQNKHHPAMKKLRQAFMRRHMSADEALARLAEIAKVDMQDFISIDEHGEPIFDLQKARGRGVMHLIKSINLERKQNPETGEVTTKVNIQLYNKRKALTDVLDVIGADEEDAEDTISQFNVQINQYLEGEEDTLFDDVDNEV